MTHGSARKMLAFCRVHNAHVRWESNGDVTVKVNKTERRRATLALAIEAMTATFTKAAVGQCQPSEDVCLRHCRPLVTARRCAEYGQP